MTYWRVEIALEGNQYFTAEMPKTSPDQKVTDIVDQICRVQYPVFPDSETEYTVLNTKKIIRMKITELTNKEVNSDEEAVHCSGLYDHRPGEYRHADGM